MLKYVCHLFHRVEPKPFTGNRMRVHMEVVNELNLNQLIFKDCKFLIQVVSHFCQKYLLTWSLGCLNRNYEFNLY